MSGPSRDRAIERLLLTSATGQPGGVPGSCVDAEAVAAWLDGGLHDPAAEQFEAHVAACPSCQELLAAVVRMTPAEVPMAPAGAGRPWTAWGVPLAVAAALVLVVWAARQSDRRAESLSPQAEGQMARVEPAVPATESASPLRQAPAAPAPNDRPSPSPPSAAAVRTKPGPPAETPGGAPAALAERVDKEVAAAAPQERQLAKAEAETKAVSAPPAAPAAQAAQTAPAPAAPVAAPQASAPQASAREEQQAQTAASNETRARRAGDAGAFAGSAVAGLRDRLADTRLVVRPPGGQSRWRVGSTVEYSADGGTTWRPASGVSPAQAADILAGAAPSALTAWLVGRRGLVLVTVDGLRFDVGPPPAAVDLVGVQATGRATAIVSAATGGPWRTSDGGRTWISVARSP